MDPRFPSRSLAGRLTAAWLLAGSSVAASAQSADAPAAPARRAAGWELGAVLDLALNSRELALGQRPQGAGLGHSDLLARGPLGSQLSAQLNLAVHSEVDDAQKLEAELEEAWVQTRSLPAGFQARLGRFSSQIGYLNEQHPHADDFVERPLLYRALLGGHWFDDGLRLNWTAPTPFYLMVGAEVFRGRQLVKEATPATQGHRPGAYTLSAKVGGDLGESQSWQAGAAWLLNRREAVVEDHEEEAGGEAEHEHEHAHGAQFSGRHTRLFDLAWKWSPQGNNRQEQVKLLLEWAETRRPNAFATAADRHRAGSLALVWRFWPEWEVGLRSDWLRASQPHEEGFEPVRLRENAAMLAWKAGHAQTLRLQWTGQRRPVGLDEVASRSVQLQYVLSFGAHGAHAF